MIAINSNTIVGHSRYELSRNQLQTNMYSIQNSNITDTFSKGTIEKDTRYSFSFSQTTLRSKIGFNYNNAIETKKETLFELLKQLNEPRREEKKERVSHQPEELYNLIGADTDNIRSDNNKVRKGVPYHYFQNIIKDAAKEYTMLLNYYNSKARLDTLA